MSNNNATNSSNIFKTKNAAALPPTERKKLALHALTGKSTITSLAEGV
ncbi:hypothetical protein [Candidatus Neptunochlamydia vexilliferae]|nr:hypothetical protein [Candidatus Neptunochlamydia vexilliferae]